MIAPERIRFVDDATTARLILRRRHARSLRCFPSFQQRARDGTRDHELGQPQQVAGGSLEQLVARQRAQRREQLAAGVAVVADAGN